MADGLRACLASVESVHRDVSAALAEAEAMLHQAQLLGVDVAVDDVDQVVESIEGFRVRVLAMEPVLRQQLEKVHAFLGSDGAVAPGHAVDHGAGLPDGASSGLITGNSSRSRLEREARRPPISVHLPDKRAGLTLPSRQPDPVAVPGGRPETDSRARASKQVDLEYQRLSGEQLAQAGFDIEYLDQVRGRPSADFRIGTKTFDCYTPEAETDLESIRVKLKNKIKKGQSTRFVVNLDRSKHRADQLRTFLGPRASSRLVEVITIKSGKIEWVWPQR